MEVSKSINSAMNCFSYIKETFSLKKSMQPLLSLEIMDIFYFFGDFIDWLVN